MQAKRSRSASSRKPGKKPANPPQEIEEEIVEEVTEYDEGFTNLKLEDLPVTADGALQDYLIRNRLLDQSFYITLYKYKDEHGDQKEYCGRYTDRIPTEHEIGMSDGSGRYILILQVTTKSGERKGTSKGMLIAKKYDSLKLQADQVPGVPMAMGMQSQDPNIAMANTMKMFAQVIAMIAPLVKPQQQQQQPEYVGKAMADNFKGMNDIMKGVYLDQAQLYQDLARGNAGLTETVEEEQESTGLSAVVNTIAGVLDQWLPAILQKGAAGQQTVKTIQTMPMFEKIKNSQMAIKKLVNFIESKHGNEVAKKVCHKFGIRKPRVIKRKVQNEDTKRQTPASR